MNNICSGGAGPRQVWGCQLLGEYGIPRTDTHSTLRLQQAKCSGVHPTHSHSVVLMAGATQRSRAFKIEWVFKVIKVIVTSAVTTMRPLR